MIDRIDFVPDELKRLARDEPDTGIPIAPGVNVPSYEITRFMTELLAVDGGKVLVLGTGSGYQTAFVALHTGAEVDSLDIRHIAGVEEKMPPNVTLYKLDCFKKVPGDEYDGILVTFATPVIPEIWTAALKEGGRIVAPVGKSNLQALRKYVKIDGKLDDQGDFGYCVFVEGDTEKMGRLVTIFTALGK